MSMPLSFTSAVSSVAAIPTPRAAAETATATATAAQHGSAGKSGAGGLSLSEHAQCAGSVEYAGR